ncbi:hypothetical protein MED01_000662 [Micromonospora sp. MED01]|uniref:hypothetical protein n=1 Tax=Micromonospora alfalfae TaxID=2911212 RepID=UPI001EE7DEEF|nr:hypothetical protein [Micromonospora alfalfae]MCG5462558.1 hypothetical protein [Micromonospora alfalfae]
MSDDRVFTAVLDTLLERLAFFELCDDETLHPDVALQQLEDAASRLGGLESADRARLAAAIAARAESFQPPFRQFVEDAPEAFGLLDEDDPTEHPMA